MSPPSLGPEPVELASGRVLRAAEPADVDAIVELEVAAFGASDEPGVRGHLAGAAVGDWTVVTDRGEVVAASGLLAHRLTLDGQGFAAGQVEYVVTRPDVQRQGLVRAQFAWHHRRAAERGDRALFITGIPYLYRRFGYGYGLDYPPFLLPSSDEGDAADELARHAAVSFRPAAPGDLDAVRALDRQRPTTGLRVERDPVAWTTIAAICVPDTFEHLLVVERDGRVLGWMRLQDKPEDGRVYLAAAGLDGAEPVATAEAMVAWARRHARPHVLVVFDQAGTAFSRHLQGTPGREWVRHDHGIYVRVPDPVALLEELRPVLSARLAASRYAGRDGELVLSLYDRGVALDLAGGEVVEVRAVDGVEDPFATGTVGVAPDWFGALVFGRWGAIGLEERADDVTLGRRRGLMEVLFPAVAADVVGDF